MPSNASQLHARIPQNSVTVARDRRCLRMHSGKRTSRKTSEMEQGMPPSHVTVQQVADDLQVHERTVQRWIADGTLKALRVGPTLLRINVQDLEVFLSGGGATQAQDKAVMGAAPAQSGESRA